MITAENLCKKFEDFVAVEDVSFNVQQGEALALLGPNGAGKTTTIRMITSILKPTKGKITVMGHDVQEHPNLVRASLGVLSENHGLYNRMKAVEYLNFFGQIYGLSSTQRKERISSLFEKFGLGGTENRRVGEFSKGMRQKLALARSLVHDPPVILLDEPTSAMDPESARLVRNLIQDLKSSRRTILICTHNLTEAEELANSIAIIQKGRIAANGTAANLRQQLLGPKKFEIRFTQNYSLDPTIFDSKINIVERGKDWFRYTASEPKDANPYVLEQLYQANLKVMYLTELTQSLEEVYLEALIEKGKDE